MAETVAELPGQPPPGVSGRLQQLRVGFVPEQDADARARLAAERPVRAEDFSTAVGRRLCELRALCDLARHLHSRL
jgi:hypothetical protein